MAGGAGGDGDADEVNPGALERVLEVSYVGEGEDANLQADMRSYVYVARTAEGWFYVGETDDLRSRIAAHRKARAFGGNGVSFVCLSVPFGGKSMARRVEAAAIRELWHQGFPLLSLSDAAHLKFGSSG